MKFITATVVFLCWASVSFASICFSLDEVDAFASAESSVSAAAATNDDGIVIARDAPDSSRAAAVNSAPALVLRSQSDGFGGLAGNTRPLLETLGGRRPRIDGIVDDNGMLVAAGASTGLGADSNGDGTAMIVDGTVESAEAGAVSTPEPSAAIVWGVLLVCGFGLVRVWRR